MTFRRKYIYFFLTVFLCSNISFAQAQEVKPRKKHKNSDTVGVVSGTPIRYYDFKQQLNSIIQEHRNEVKDSVVSDTAYTRFVNMTWDKLIGDIIIEQELSKRKLSFTTEKTIEKLLN